MRFVDLVNSVWDSLIDTNFASQKGSESRAQYTGPADRQTPTWNCFSIFKKKKKKENANAQTENTNPNTYVIAD